MYASHIICTRLFLLLVLLFNTGTTTAFCQQVSADSLRSTVEFYKRSKPSDILYLVTDKDFYLPGETIWFMGYLFENTKRADTISPDLLSVALLRDDTTEVSVIKNFVVNDGLCPGSLTLPESLSPGSYLLLSCTNIVNEVGEPVHVFRKPITVGIKAKPLIAVDFEVHDKSAADSVIVVVKALFPSDITNADRRRSSLSYQFFNGESQRVKFDDEGKAIIALSYEEIANSNHILYTITSIGKQSKCFNVRLPKAKKNELKVQFYPEGGDLVQGLPSRVAWQVLDAEGHPVAFKALLLENGKVIEEVQTDKHGMGVFEIRPKENREYALQALESKSESPTEYHLPKALRSGVVIKAQNAVAKDTLSIHIGSTRPIRLRMAITNMYSKETTMLDPIVVIKERSVSILLNETGKGLNLLTLLDDQGHPVVERMFFAHADKQNRVVLKTSKESYGFREKVSVEVNIHNSAGRSLRGLFAISCVHSARLDKKHQENIVSYYYMYPSMGKVNGDLSKTDEIYRDKEYLENMLLVKGWRRYLWQQTIQYDPEETYPSLSRLKIKGQVFDMDGEKVEKPYALLVKRDIFWGLRETDNRGSFLIIPREIFVPEDGYLQVKVLKNGEAADNVTIRIDDPMEYMMGKVKVLPYVSETESSTSQNDLQHLLADEIKTSYYLMKSVVVTAGGEVYNVNDCGDYVCMKGILNCINHPSDLSNNGPPPVVGEKYKFWETSGAPHLIEVLYEGCMWEEKLSVYTAKEFNGMDSTKLAETFDKQFMPTIYWNPRANTNNTKFDFYTSDLSGTYRIRVEGVAENGDLFYGEKMISVRER